MKLKNIAVCYIARFSRKKDVTTSKMQLNAFLDSYRLFNAGVEHQKWIILKGGLAFDLLSHVKNIAPEFNVLMASDRGYDLHAYTQFITAVRPSWAFCLNSSSKILVANWLEAFTTAAVTTSSVFVGNTGSWSSHSDPAHHDPNQSCTNLLLNIKNSLRSKRYKNQYLTFPNPHVRTNGFLIDANIWLEFIGRNCPKTKKECHLLESGMSGLTNHILNSGGRFVLVDRFGTVYDHRDWVFDGAFRTPKQDEHIIISDNQTRHFSEKASKVQQARLCFETWRTNFKL